LNQRELFKALTERLKANAAVTSPELEARWIIERAVGVPSSKWVEDAEFSSDDPNLNFIEEATQKRISGIPLAYVLGEKEFFGLNFMVNSHVLIPRPESELIVELALKKLQSHPGPCRILDLGSGSGCLGLTLLKHSAEALLCAVDISVDALDVTDFNSKSLGVHDRTTLLSIDAAELQSTDLPERFEGQVDLVVANPPYIAEGDPNVDPWVKQYEPSVALFSDEDGLGHFRRWVHTLPNVLAPKGLALFEIGFTQAEAARKTVQELMPRRPVQIFKDLAGNDRVVKIDAQED
jgi:release factor glutamine methyltransferase